MHFRRGILAGFCWGLAGLVCAAAGIAAFTFESGHSLSSNIAWWRLHAFPGLVVIPLFLFFAGVVTYTPTRHVGFAKNLAILGVTVLPFAAILGLLGMDQPRYKGNAEHPPMYLSEVLMFLLPLTAVSCLLILKRSVPSAKRDSPAGDSVLSSAAATEPSEEPKRKRQWGS